MKPNLTNKKPLKILLTGFGPFRTHKQNASFEIIRELARKMGTNMDGRIGDEKIELMIYPEPIRVSYSEVGRVMKKIFTSHQFDLVIHLGVSGRLERCEYVIEKLANSIGFNSTDVDGFIGEEVLKKLEWNHWNSAPNSLQTSIDIQQVIQLVDQEKLNLPINLKSSEDAGGYLCEFIYYNSLLHYYQSECKEEDGNKQVDIEQGEKNEKLLPVLFLHVPVFVEESELELGTSVVELILKSWVKLYCKI